MMDNFKIILCKETEFKNFIKGINMKENLLKIKEKVVVLLNGPMVICIRVSLLMIRDVVKVNIYIIMVIFMLEIGKMELIMAKVIFNG